MEYLPNKTKKWLLVAIGFLIIIVVVVVLVKNKSAEWTKIGESATLAYYADTSSVRKSGNNATIWTLVDNKEAQEDNGKLYISSKQQYEIDCNGVRNRLVRFTLYAEKMGAGREVATSNLPAQEWGPASPGTVSGSMLELSCKPWWKVWN